MNSEEIYIQKAIEQVPRLLSRLDRNPYSPVYGSFDWLYWSEKLHDTAMGRPQEAGLVLALLYKFEFPGSECFYRNRKILEWCIASMKYWCKIQHNDGSVDENYYNERQFGATAFTLYAIAKSFLLIKDEIDDTDKGLILAGIEKAADFVADYDETYLLTNHQTMAIIAMHLAEKSSGKEYKKPIESKLNRIIEGKSKDGWLKEYFGADLGYLTISIANLAEYNEDVKNAELSRILREAVEYISYFLTPDGTFGGVLGVRNTAHFWLNGFERFCDEIGLACSISQWAKKMIVTNSLMTPGKDDWYFGCLIYDILLSYLCTSKISAGSKLPFERENFIKHFEDSGIIIQKDGNVYLIVNGFKGGILKAWDCVSKELIKSDAGLIGRLKSGSIVTTNCPDPKYEIEVDIEKSSVVIKGQFHSGSSEYPTFFKYTLFKIFNLVFGKNVKITNFIKDILIKKIITKEKLHQAFFERHISLPALKITDSIKTTGGAGFESLMAMDELVLVGMGYARYFHLSDLHTKSHIFNREQVDNMNRGIAVSH